MRSLKKFGAVAAVACGLASVSMATPITFTGSSGTLAASVTFDTSGTNLVVTLSNTSASDVLVPTDVLTAVFFDLPGVGLLTTVSALLGPPGSTVFYDPDGQPALGVVGGEWAYGAGLAGPGGATRGLSSSGYGLFGAANFPGADLAGPPGGAVDGLQYGLLSTGDNSATGNGGITGSQGLVRNSVVFTLSGLTSGYDPSIAGITNVSFQYGTALTEPNVPSSTGGGGGSSGNGIPEPNSSALALLGVALLAVTFLKRQKSHRV
jgi:hypothetical protein